MATNFPQRLAGIDLLRGLTVMLMIFVNNGAGECVFPILTHAAWNGMTLADCVMPSFLFIVGMTTYLSLRKYGFRWSHEVAAKVCRRTALLFLIGLGLNWLGLAMEGRPLDFAHLRVYGVMQRIAICYFLTATLCLTCRRAFLPVIIGGLALYAALLLEAGGYSFNASCNFLAQFDLRLMGQNHLYFEPPLDPEGFFSNLAATLHTMAGFVVMEWLGRQETVKGKIRFLVIVGVIIVVVGLAFTPWLPLNKRIWSPSYSLLNCGIDMLVFAVFLVLTDMRGSKGVASKDNALSVLLKSFGMNPLVLYVGSEVVATIFWSCGIADCAYRTIHSVITDASWAGFAYTLSFTAIFALIGLGLYHKKIIIKL